MAEDYPYHAGRDHGAGPEFAESSARGNPILLADCGITVFSFLVTLGTLFYTYTVSGFGAGRWAYFIAAMIIAGLAGAASFYGNLSLYAGRRDGLVWTFGASVYRLLSSLHTIMQTSIHLFSNQFDGAPWTPLLAGGPSLVWNVIFVLFLLRFNRRGFLSQ